MWPAQKTPWEKAIDKRKSRIDRGHEGHRLFKDGNLAKCPHFNELSTIYHNLKAAYDVSSYDTIAVASVDGLDEIVIALKFPVRDAAETVRTATGFATGTSPNAVVHVILIGDDWEENLHAEMRIIRYLVTERQPRIPKEDLDENNISIYCEKGVCPDCWAWLDRNSVQGYPPRKTAAKGWTHPLTGANFLGQGRELNYVKVSKYGRQVLSARNPSGQG